MEVVQASFSGVPLLRVVGDIDHDTSAAFDAAVKSSLALDQAVSAARGRGWVGVLRPNPDVSRLLEIVGLLADESFVLFADEAQAAEHIQASGQQDSSPSPT